MDYPHSNPKVGLHSGKFTDGAADGSYPPSLDPADWANAVTDEIKAVITAAGLVPTEGNNTQMAAAIAALIAASAVTGLKSLAYLDAGLGLENDGAGNARVKLNGATLLRVAAGLSLNLAATNVWSGTQSGTEAVIADAATLNWDLAAKQEASVTLGGNRLSGTPTNIVNGTIYELLVIQPPAGGPYTLTFSSDFTNVSGVSWSGAANAIDRCVFRANGGKLRMVSFQMHIGGA